MSDGLVTGCKERVYTEDASSAGRIVQTQAVALLPGTRLVADEQRIESLRLLRSGTFDGIVT